MTLRTPGGKPACCASYEDVRASDEEDKYDWVIRRQDEFELVLASMRARPEKGVSSGTLMTQVQPAARLSDTNAMQQVSY